MPRFAAALLVYSRVSDEAYYLALNPRSVGVRRAPRLEELFWAPTEAFDVASAANAAVERFVPRLGNTVLQTYVVGVKPFLLDEEALIARDLVRWNTPLPEWFSKDEAA